MFRIHKSTENSSADPLIDQDQGAIRGQINEWFQTLESGKVAIWLFDASLHQLYESERYEFVHNLLTKTRHAVTRSDNSSVIRSPMRIVVYRQLAQWPTRTPHTQRRTQRRTNCVSKSELQEGRDCPKLVPHAPGRRCRTQLRKC